MTVIIKIDRFVTCNNNKLKLIYYSLLFPMH